MLRQIVDDYFKSLPNERALDAPFMALLGALGYSNVFYTHGQHELGKDFIAQGDGAQTQYCFQAKHSDLTGHLWQSTVQHQMTLAADSGLPHPGFNHSLPIKAILVLTGELRGNAQLGVDAFNRAREAQGRLPIDVWNRSRLVELALAVDPAILYSTDTSGYEGYGEFFRQYGAAIGAELTERGFEKHSRNWSTAFSPRQALFIATMEAHVVAERAARAGQRYEAFAAILAAFRALMVAWYRDPSAEYFIELMKVTAESVCAYAVQYCEAIEALQGRALLSDTGGPAAIITLRLTCLRYAECTALLSYLSPMPEDRGKWASRLVGWLASEPSSHEPISDRFAVSIIAAARAAWDSGSHDVARQYVRDTAKWTFARYADGAGLGSVEDNESDATQRFLYPRSCGDRDSSLLATALIDLAAYFADSSLYDDIVNDIGACEMIPEYYRARETEGQFAVDASDVEVLVAGVKPRLPLTPFGEFKYAEHVESEERTLLLAETFGSSYPLALSLLLRDRWFPTTWIASPLTASV